MTLTSFHLHKKSNEVCFKARSTPASLLFKGLVTEHRTVKMVNFERGRKYIGNNVLNKRSRPEGHVIKCTPNFDIQTRSVPFKSKPLLPIFSNKVTVKVNVIFSLG